MGDILKTILILIILPLLFFSARSEEPAVIDSDLTFEEAIEGTKAPDEVKKSLVLLDVEYYSFDGKLHRGQLVIDKAVENDVREVFELIKKSRFPVGKVIPIVKYGWSDDASMEDNNTSAFNYRYVAGTKRLSNHSFGRAVDINPFLNPVIYSNGKISPSGAKYDPAKPGTFHKDHPVVKEFLSRGWRWGGNWNSLKDNHHFDKPQ